MVRRFIKRNENKFFDLSLDTINENKTALELVSYAIEHDVQIYSKGRTEIRDITSLALSQAICYCIERNLIKIDLLKMLRTLA
jgi:hypothetical protein